MTPEKIAAKEESFALKLIDSAATQFTETGRTQIGGGFEIVHIKAPFDTYYYKTVTEKKQICLHFTAGVITGDISTLAKNDYKVSVPYVVDRTGRIYQLFDDKYWSYHLGASTIGGNSAMSKKCIGIEISNYGPLTFDGTSYKNIYGETFTTDSSKVVSTSYRGYEYYERMPDRQMDAVCYLVKYLSEKHGIDDIFKFNMGTVFNTDSEALNFCGVYCHTDVRKDKFDWPTEIARMFSDRYFALFRNELIAEEHTEQETTTTQETVVETPIEHEQTKNEPATIAETTKETTMQQVQETAKNVTEGLNWLTKILTWLTSLLQKK